MKKEPTLTVKDMREQVAANTSVMQLVAKQQLDIVNAIVALKNQVDALMKSIDAHVPVMVVGPHDRMDSGYSHAVGNTAVPEASD